MSQHDYPSGCRQGLVALGPLPSGDRDAVLDVFEGLSERSRRLRFHGLKPRLREQELDELVDVGCCGRRAVVATDLVSGRVVGIARFVRDDDDSRSAEVAFAVIDACQSSGVGRRLVDELRKLAMLEGIDRFKAHVVPGNEPALALMSRMGRVVRSSYGDGAHELEVALAA